MDIRQYLLQQCARHGIRRGDLPALLGYTNSAKALRRFDEVLAGRIPHREFLRRLRSCELFDSKDVDLALAHTAHQAFVDARETAHQNELRKRLAFRPHLWFEHERRYPSPIFVVGLFGEERFRVLELPDDITSTMPPSYWLVEVTSFLKDFVLHNKNHSVLRGPFGKAIRAIYRDTYDHGYVFDLDTFEIIEERNSPPRTGRVTCTRGRGTSVRRRHR